MAWVKLSDDWYDNGKIQQVSDLAELLWIRCLTWSCRNLTDGLVPRQAVRRLVPSTDRPDPDLDGPRLAAELVTAGLWEESDWGYAIHDILQFNLSRTQVHADRQKDANRKRLPA
jgi:hypothetical protein